MMWRAKRRHIFSTIVHALTMQKPEAGGDIECYLKKGRGLGYLSILGE
jgi:hypothetical protein